MQFPIIIGLRRSRFVDGALLVLSLGALLVIGFVPWPPLVSLPLGGAVIFFALYAERALRPCIAVLRIDKDGKITGKLVGQSAFVPLGLLVGTTVHPWLTVLRLAGEEGVYRLVIAPDSARPDESQRLRV